MKVKLLHEAAKAPEQSGKGYTLFAIERVVVHGGGQPSILRTGLEIELPEGIEGILVPSAKIALAGGYLGQTDLRPGHEVVLLLSCLDSIRPVVVLPGDPIAKLLLVAVAKPKVQVEGQANASRVR
jgi:dUTPase